MRLLDLEGAEVGPRIAGREAAWTAGGLFVLDNGRKAEEPPGARVGNAIHRISGGARRTITDADRLARDVRAAFAPGLGRLAASADGSHLSAFLFGFPNDRGQTLAMIRTDDGVVTSLLSSEFGRASFSDIEWSPRDTLVGHTSDVWSGSGPIRTSSALVRDAKGRILAERDGRFAGWSADGAWFYVSRPAGLFAYRVDGSAERKVGPLGVSIATTRP